MKTMNNKIDQKENYVEEDTIQQVAHKVTEVMDKDFKQLTKVRADLALQKYRNQVLMEVCDNLNIELQDLNQRMENMELNNAKRMVIVSGLDPPSSKKEDLIGFLEEFLAYLLGSSVVIEFQNAYDKWAVMQRKTALKNYHSEVRIYINDYVPITTQEKRRRERKIKIDIKENEDPQVRKLTVEYTKAGLTVQGRPYRKMINPPTPKDLVGLEVDDIDKLMQIKLKRSKEQMQDGSRFIAYTT